MFLRITFRCLLAREVFDSEMGTTMDTVRENVRELGSYSQGTVSEFIQSLPGFRTEFSVGGETFSH